MKPLVSIIIPTYNRAHLIGETLDSVIAQTYTNWECIVVDDGSTDNTKEVLAEYCKKDARFQFHNRPANRQKGGNAARNYGFEVSKGEYINWLDSDDLLTANKLEVQVNALIKSKRKVCVSNGQFFLKKPKDIPKVLWSHKLVEKDIIDSLISQKTRWQTGAVLWSRQVINYQNWNEELKGAQEWLFHILMAIKLPSSDFYFMNDVVLFIRSSNTSITRHTSKTKRFKAYLYARILLLNKLKTNHNNLFLKYYRVTYLICIKYFKHLIKRNHFKLIIAFSILISRVSLVQFFKFYFGLIIYRLTNRDYFLKRIVK